MVEEIKLIATILASKMRELGHVDNVHINEESFKLYMKIKDLDFILSLSLHHLDIPWQITSEILKNGIEVGNIEKFIYPDYSYETPVYEVTPLFLKNTSYNMVLLADKIKMDVMKILKLQDLNR